MGFTLLASENSNSHQNRWGLWAFALGVIGTFATLLFAFGLSPSSNPAFYTDKLPKIGIFLSILCLVFGHFSYPRINNPKVYLLGYTSAITGLMIFGFNTVGFFNNNQRPAPGFINLVFLFIMLNQILAIIFPFSLKYRWTRRITWCVAGIELCVAYLIRYILPIPLFLQNIHMSHSLLLSGLICAVLTVFLTHLFVGKNFGLAGILSGGVFIIAVAGWGQCYLKDLNK